MPPPDTLVPAAALVAMLVTAYAHPRGRIEAGRGIVAVAATLAAGVLDAEAVREELSHLGPVVIFLVTILVVGDVCGRSGVFAAAAGWVRRLSRDRPVPLLTGVFTGSLANPLWRRTLRRHGERPSLLEFHRMSMLVTPVTLFGAVSTLALVTHDSISPRYWLTK